MRKDFDFKVNLWDDKKFNKYEKEMDNWINENYDSIPRLSKLSAYLNKKNNSINNLYIYNRIKTWALKNNNDILNDLIDKYEVMEDLESKIAYDVDRQLSDLIEIYYLEFEDYYFQKLFDLLDIKDYCVCTYEISYDFCDLPSSILIDKVFKYKKIIYEDATMKNIFKDISFIIIAVPGTSGFYEYDQTMIIKFFKNYYFVNEKYINSFNKNE